MKRFLKEFKSFAMRGNVVDMAVGIIIGGAFGKIVSSAVADLFMPVLGLFVGGVNFSDLSLTLKKAVIENGQTVEPAVVLTYGNFVQVVFDFIIIAFCICLFIKAINKLTHKKEEAPAPDPAPAADILLLQEIRDLLKAQNDKKPEA